MDLEWLVGHKTAATITLIQGVRSHPVQARHIVLDSPGERPYFLRILRVIRVSFRSRSGLGLTAPFRLSLRPGGIEMGRSTGIIPLFAKYSTPVRMHSSVSPSPMMMLPDFATFK